MKGFLSFLICSMTLLALRSGALAATPAEGMNDPSIKAALESIQRNFEEEIETQVNICQIAAPEYKEQERAKYLFRLFQEGHLQNVRIDAAGNVLGDRPGKFAHPHLVFAAHLDTVFPEGTNVHVERQGMLLKGPGINDDCRGLAVMVSIIRAMDRARLQTQGTITFVADVGEEATGDLRGMKELFGKTMAGKIDEMISVEGPFPIDWVANQSVGSYRYRLTYSGPGGHSFANFGNANPIHALGRAIAAIDAFEVPASPKTTFNVGVISGGTSVNSIAASASADIDLRSTDNQELEKENRQLRAAAQRALDEENQRWQGRGKIQMHLEQSGYRPSGLTPASSSLVKTIAAVHEAMKLPPIGLRAESTDANIPTSMGIPAITVGGGGISYGPHTVHESADITNAWIGTQRDFLLTVMLANESVVHTEAAKP